MWKRTEKQELTADEKSVDKDGVNGDNVGARKVALLLSILEPETAEALLSLFPPKIAHEIAHEARRVEHVLPEDVNAAVTEFLDSIGRETVGEELANALVDEARRRVDASVLESVDAESLARSLASERNAIRAVALALLPDERRKRMLAELDARDSILIGKYVAAFRDDQEDDARERVKHLEDVLFELALDNE